VKQTPKDTTTTTGRKTAKKKSGETAEKKEQQTNRTFGTAAAPEKMKRSTGEEEIAGADLGQGGAEADRHLFTPPPPLVTL
jgi:hypothetical protein